MTVTTTTKTTMIIVWWFLRNGNGQVQEGQSEWFKWRCYGGRYWCRREWHPQPSMLHFTIEQIILTTMVLQMMTMCRVSIIRWKLFWNMLIKHPRNLSTNWVTSSPLTKWWHSPKVRAPSSIFAFYVQKYALTVTRWQVNGPALGENKFSLCLLCLYVPSHCSWCMVGYLWCGTCMRSTLHHYPYVSCNVLYKSSNIHHHALWFLASLKHPVDIHP